MGKVGGIIVPIISSFDKKGFTAAERGLRGITAAFGAMAAAAAAAAIKVGIDGVQAYIADAAAAEKLATTLRNTTDATSQQVQAVEDFILKAALATGVSDEKLRPAFSRLTIATQNITASQELMNLALDISAGSGKNLDSVVQALAKSYEGTNTSLSRLGVGLSAAELSTMSFEDIVKSLSGTFQGQAAVQADTFAGRMEILKVRFDEVSERIGEELLPIAIDLLEWIEKEIVPNLDEWADALTESVLPALKTTFDMLTSISNFLQENRWLWDGQVSLADHIGEQFRVTNEELTKTVTETYNKVEENRANIAESLQKSAEDTTDWSTMFGTAASSVGSSAAAAADKVDKTAEKIKKANDKMEAAWIASMKAAKEAQKAAIEATWKTLQALNSAVSDIIAKQAEYGQKFSDAITGVLSLSDAASEAGDETGKSFMQSLLDQVAKAQMLAAKVKQLIKMGLSQAGIDQIIASGADLGGRIADEILATGQAGVNQVNALFQQLAATGGALAGFASESVFGQELKAATAAVDAARLQGILNGTINVGQATFAALAPDWAAVGVQPTSYNITVNGALDPEAVARQIDSIMRTSAGRTGNYTTFGLAPLAVG